MSQKPSRQFSRHIRVARCECGNGKKPGARGCPRCLKLESERETVTSRRSGIADLKDGKSTNFVGIKRACETFLRSRGLNSRAPFGHDMIP